MAWSREARFVAFDMAHALLIFVILKAFCSQFNVLPFRICGSDPFQVASWCSTRNSGLYLLVASRSGLVERLALSCIVNVFMSFHTLRCWYGDGLTALHVFGVITLIVLAHFDFFISSFDLFSCQ